jgi:hypothetical protein
MKQVVCPMIQVPCQYCSDEKKGAFCNNDGRHYVSELSECPIPGARTVPLVPVELSELQWMARRETA